MSVTIRCLRDDDMRELAGRLRAMDHLELISMVPDRPVEEVLVASGHASLRSRSGLWNGNLVACWGVVPRTPEASDGAPWLLATDAIDRPEVRRAFLKHGAEELRRLTHGFDYLWNFVHRDNAVARRWLGFMGFEFRDRHEYVISGEPFVRFELENN